MIKQAAGYARRQAPATNRHNEQNRETAEKARRRLKYGDTRRLSVFAVFFLRRRDLSLFNGAFLSAVLFAPLFLCRLRSVTIGSPKASVIVSKASLLARANVSLVCQGSPRIAWCNVVAKSLTQKKITAYAVIFLVRLAAGRLRPQKKNNSLRCHFFGASSGTRTLDPLIKSQLLYQLS